MLAFTFIGLSRFRFVGWRVAVDSGCGAFRRSGPRIETPGDDLTREFQFAEGIYIAKFTYDIWTVPTY